MKVLILAGGYGTRLSEETDVRPKPMIEVGGRPILWHIMKIYSHYKFNDFVILTGYKGYYIKEYFANYFLHQSDVTFDLSTNTVTYHRTKSEPWRVTILDTGLHTMTGGRIKQAADHINGERFMLTYGDGLADVNISNLLDFHCAHGKYATVTSVQPDGRFGALELDSSSQVQRFNEKPKGDGTWVNGGFFVCEPQVLDYITDDNIVFEQQPLEHLAADGQLVAYKHTGFWKPMDTLRDKNQLNQLWESGQAQWKVFD